MSEADGIAVECARCGVTEKAARTLEAVTDPRDGETRALCDECHAHLMEHETLLSPQQARILALWTAGWSTGDIADALGMSDSNVSTQKGNIRSKASEAVEQLQRADSTLAVLDDLDT